MDVQCCHKIEVIRFKLDQNTVHTNPTEEPMDRVSEHPCFKALCNQYDVEDFHHIVTSEGYKTNCNTNARMRYTAYKMFTWWTHGRLGYQVQKPIPSCVAKAICAKYEAHDEKEYVGFEDVPLDKLKCNGSPTMNGHFQGHHCFSKSKLW